MADDIQPTPIILDQNTPATAARITIIQQVYHQVPSEETSSPPVTRFYRWLESDEQAFKKTVKVGTSWQPLDIGWFTGKKASVLCIGNFIKRQPSRKPTQDEIDEFNSRLLEIGIDVGNGVRKFASIPVGEDMRICDPEDLSYFRIRCPIADSKYNIFIVGI